MWNEASSHFLLALPDPNNAQLSRCVSFFSFPDCAGVSLECRSAPSNGSYRLSPGMLLVQFISDLFTIHFNLNITQTRGKPTIWTAESPFCAHLSLAAQKMRSVQITQSCCVWADFGFPHPAFLVVTWMLASTITVFLFFCAVIGLPARTAVRGRCNGSSVSVKGTEWVTARRRHRPGQHEC